MKVLFTSPIIEHPAAGGPALRIENSIKALSRQCELYIVSRVSMEAIGGEAAENFYKGFCRGFWYAPSARLSTNRYLRKVQKEWHKFQHFDADVRFILGLVDRLGIEVWWSGYGNISFELIDRIKALRPGLKVVCDTDSVWSRFVLRELPLESSPRRRKEIELEGRKAEAWERKVVDLCEVTAAVSEVDAVYYRALAADQRRIRIFSNVIDLETYRVVPAAVPGYKKPCIYLAGTFGHANSPMDRAARWMIDEVLPIVKKAIPDIHFYMVGKGSEALWGSLNDPSITVTGKLPSVLPYLCNADVAVVPLKFESGTRFKILEAGACGIPIVSTTLGAEGIPVVHGRDIILADEPKAFAQAIVQLIKDKDLKVRISQNCLQLVRQRYSVEYLASEAQDILRGLEK